jgi:hypothetical protein
MKFLGLLILAIDIWALWHCWTRSLEIGPKILWSIAIIVFPILGPVLYVLFGRSASK